jgi:FtsP/CotA-like multicopper oxidase with cupredoxin domain
MWAERFNAEGRNEPMSTLLPDPRGYAADEAPTPAIDYATAEGLNDAARLLAPDAEAERRNWILVAVGLVGLVAVIAVLVAIVALATGGTATQVVTAAPAADSQAEHAAVGEPGAAPTLADAKGVEFEKFTPVDPKLPAIPAGPVKKFKVDVYQHVTQVSKTLAPTEVWSFAVNGVEHRGTGVSQPMVVTEGDTVDFTLVNGSKASMNVNMPHSVDFHSAEVNPGTRYVDLAPGKSIHYRFVAKHPGVFMYHCATQPVLMHTGAGMVGMFVVKPKDLAPVDKELWMTQQEYYIGQPGKTADMAKMQAKRPDVIAFNGYANQYQDAPIAVKKGERVRMYVLNAGPSIWSAFHVIGTVFDTTHTDNGIAHDVQTINLAPSQGGWVEFTLDEEGGYPFVTHAFGDAVKGAIGVLKTPHAPAGAGHDMGGSTHSEHATTTTAAAGGGADVNVTLGDMWVKSDQTTVKAGKVSFAVKNEGGTTHGLAIAPTPVKQSGGMLDKTALLGVGGELAAGADGTVTADLKPGSYELVCFMAGHYAAGQKLPFQVQ